MRDLGAAAPLLGTGENVIVSTRVVLAGGRLVDADGRRLNARDVWDPPVNGRRLRDFAKLVPWMLLLPVAVLALLFSDVTWTNEAVVFRGSRGSLAWELPGDVQQGSACKRFRAVLVVTQVRLLIWVCDTQRAESPRLAWQAHREQVAVRRRRRWFRVFAVVEFSDGSMVRLKTSSNRDARALAALGPLSR